jgi:predicted nuclease of predicted toxin-antitoxin system
MRLLLDENIARAVVSALRERGHDVAWIRESSPGIDDARVLAMAQAEHRTLITFDKDFGELAFRHGLPADCGVLLFRVAASSPALMAEVVVKVVDGRDDWAGHFSVVELDRVRMTPLRSSK